MKKMYRYFYVPFFIVLLLLLQNMSFGQCPTDLLSGQNLVINGDFSQGYAGWTYTPDPTRAVGYAIFNPPGWSNPGNIYVGSNPVTFNPGPPPFMSYGDHTSGSGNMLMVDGICVLGIKLWQQSGIPIKPNTNYYFSVWISSLKDQPNFPGVLNFDINGTNIGSLITAPALGATWIKYETIWNSGPTPPATVTISIENSNTVGCASEVDFAIDDISFIPGCAYGAPGPQPNLGADRTICGTGGSIVLNANVPINATTTVTWSSNVSGPISGTGLGAPYTKTITAPGTYSVCVSDNGSCTKSDIIVITNTFSINLGPDLNLCNPTSTTLDAQFTGTGVTYQWFRNHPTLAPAPNNARTYLVTTPGTYRVNVTDPLCGVQSDIINITSSAPTPVDAYYCTAGETPTLSVTGSGTFRWYTTATKGTGTLLGSGSNYTTPALTPSSTYTYYVEDITVTPGVVGQTTEFSSGNHNNYIYNLNDHGTNFTVTQDFSISSVQVPIRISNPNGTTNNTMAIRLEVCDASGNVLAPRINAISSPVVIPFSANTFTLYTFSFTNFTIPASVGPNLMMKLFITDAGGSTRLTNYEDWRFEIGKRENITGTIYPYNSTIPGVVSLTSLREFGNNQSNKYALYNWNIGATTPCARIPVRAIYNCPTPVDWVQYSVYSINSTTAKIQWSTAKEINNSHFIVWRSLDGINWTSIGRLNGSGTTSSINRYEFIDTAVPTVIAYYKIQQMDSNGDTSSTPILTHNTEDWLVRIYPNPFDQHTELYVSTPTTVPVTYRIYSPTGIVLVMDERETNQAINIPELASSGIYIVQVQVMNEIKSIKLIKN